MSTYSSPFGDPPYPNYSPPASSGWGWGVNPVLPLPLNSDEEFIKLRKRVEEIEKRLAILHPNEELQAKYPALQEAYDAYKIMEKIVNDAQR
jgi:hypothetical protein